MVLCRRLTSAFQSLISFCVPSAWQHQIDADEEANMHDTLRAAMMLGCQHFWQDFFFPSARQNIVNHFEVYQRMLTDDMFISRNPTCDRRAYLAPFPLELRSRLLCCIIHTLYNLQAALSSGTSAPGGQTLLARTEHATNVCAPAWTPACPLHTSARMRIGTIASFSHLARRNTFECVPGRFSVLPAC